MKKNSHFLILLLFVVLHASANVTLPTIFSDGMVLQRNANAKIWGWANPGEAITILTGWNGKEYKATPSNQAYWSMEVTTPDAGGPYSITIKGYNEIQLKNILIGEVWICSGQSNMEMNAGWGIANGDAEATKADYPDIHFFTVPKRASDSPQQDFPGSWTVCTPETMKHFSAVGYFFALRLREDLKGVPIGLISSNWGGTPAEIWMAEKTVEQNTVVQEAAVALKVSQWGPTEPGHAYNAMIHPLIGYRIAGVLWYQGESNVGSAVYDQTLGALITSWRNSWGYNFPFYYVQIAPYRYGEDHAGGAIIRDAQRKVQNTIPNTGMVLTSDISTIDDIHPKDKKTVGTRLANLALVDWYKTNNAIVNGPLFKSTTVRNGKLYVAFDYAQGLYFKNKKTSLFEIAGTDGQFYPAQAKIIGNEIALSAVKVPNPVHVRYAWKNTDQADLFNAAGLPASTFQSE